MLQRRFAKQAFELGMESRDRQTRLLSEIRNLETTAELHAGARNERERELLREFTSSFEVIAAEGSICEMGGDLRATYRPSHGVDLIDAIIAATSIIKRIPLATLNKKHFHMLKDVVVPYQRQS